MEDEYYKTKDSVDEYIRLAKGYDGKLLIEQFKKKLNPNSVILEIGSGPGTDWEILTNSYHVIGSDNSSEFLDHLQSKYPKGDFLQLDASTLETDKQFDAIYSNKVLHHLNENELITSIKRQFELLNPNGIICHSFWKGEGSEVFKGLFVNYHTEKAIKTYFETYFDIILLDVYEEFEPGDSLLLIARKKQLQLL